jgi:hypothetical protein
LISVVSRSLSRRYPALYPPLIPLFLPFLIPPRSSFVSHSLSGPYPA